jgi:hypothetical protein
MDDVTKMCEEILAEWVLKFEYRFVKSGENGGGILRERTNYLNWHLKVYRFPIRPITKWFSSDDETDGDQRFASMDKWLDLSTEKQSTLYINKTKTFYFLSF